MTTLPEVGIAITWHRFEAAIAGVWGEATPGTTGVRFETTGTAAGIRGEATPVTTAGIRFKTAGTTAIGDAGTPLGGLSLGLLGSHTGRGQNQEEGAGTNFV